MKTRYRKPTRKQPTRAPEYALVVAVTIESGHPAGDVFRSDVKHPQSIAWLASGTIRLFDPATDSRGPSFPFRNLWEREDSEWFPETEGWWAVRVKPEHCNEAGTHMRFQYGSIGHPRSFLQNAREDMDRLRKVDPAFAAKCEVVKLPCVMSNRESHIVVCD